MEIKFYRCQMCGKIIAMVDTNGCGCPTKCCGSDMVEIVPNTTEASTEKHLPVVAINDNIVSITVGSVEHPMLESHYIQWITLITDKGNQRKVLKPESSPKVEFALLPNEKVISVLAYCNIHGLWKIDC